MFELELGGEVLDEKHATNLVVDGNVLCGNLELPCTLVVLPDLELGAVQQLLVLLDLSQAETRVTLSFTWIK